MRIIGGDVFCTKDYEENGIHRTKGDFEKKDVYIDGSGRFSKQEPIQDEDRIDASGCYVIPGLVDVHMHGCAGYDFCDASGEAIERISEYQFSQGITSFCATTMTLSEERLLKILTTADKVPYDGRHANVCGIHMEGPFVSEKKMGAQNPAYIIPPDEDMFVRFQEAAAVPIRLITLAPELSGALSFIDRFSGETHISIGHTAGSYEDAREAILHGADHITHLYNAMTGFAHREPGIVGAAAEARNVYVELICDGMHVHPAAVRATFAMMGADRMVLISDSMRATGLPDGESELGGQVVYKKGLRAILKDGNLAASVTPLMECMRCAVRFGIPLPDAVLAATVNPAKSIGLGEEIGCISPGAKGNAVILNKNLEIVRVI